MDGAAITQIWFLFLFAVSLIRLIQDFWDKVRHYINKTLLISYNTHAVINLSFLNFKLEFQDRKSDCHTINEDIIVLI